MRVAAFLMSYPPERMVGAELMSAEFLEAVVDAGHEVTVYTDSIDKTFDRNGVHVKPRSAFNPRKKTADIVYSHPDLGAVGYIAAGLYRVPYVAVVHNTGNRNREYLIKYPPTLTIWNSYSTKAALNGDHGLVIRSKLRIKDHAVDKPGDSVTIINCTKAKGIDTFLAVATSTPYPMLAVRGGYGLQEIPKTPSPTLATIGPIPHTLMRKKVWAHTRILLMPSADESWGRAAVEALCSGIPVIAHPTDGLKESLGDAGIFIDRNNHKAWIETVDQLMTLPTKYAEASRRAKARAKELEQITTQDLHSLIQALEELTTLHN